MLSSPASNSLNSPENGKTTILNSNVIQNSEF